jgi:hypothetical protein
MDELDQLIVEHYGDEPDFCHSEEFLSRSKTEVIPWFPQNDGISDFDGIAELESLAELTRRILGEDWKALYCMVMFSKQGTVGQAWHQDCSPNASDKFNLNRLVYTRDIDVATGGQIVVVPGSHRRGAAQRGAAHLARPYLASCTTRDWKFPLLNELPGDAFGYPRGHHRCLRVSQYALLLFYRERRRGACWVVPAMVSSRHLEANSKLPSYRPCLNLLIIFALIDGFTTAAFSRLEAGRRLRCPGGM